MPDGLGRQLGDGHPGLARCRRRRQRTEGTLRRSRRLFKGEGAPPRDRQRIRKPPADDGAERRRARGVQRTATQPRRLHASTKTQPGRPRTRTCTCTSDVHGYGERRRGRAPAPATRTATENVDADAHLHQRRARLTSDLRSDLRQPTIFAAPSSLPPRSPQVVPRQRQASTLSHREAAPRPTLGDPGVSAANPGCPTGRST
jgi:hypothetical protein